MDGLYLWQSVKEFFDGGNHDLWAKTKHVAYVDVLVVSVFHFKVERDKEDTAVGVHDIMDGYGIPSFFGNAPGHTFAFVRSEELRAFFLVGTCRVWFGGGVVGRDVGIWDMCIFLF